MGNGAGLRPRWSRGLIAASLILAVVGGVGAAAAKWPHAKWQVSVIAAFVGFILPQLVDKGRAWKQERDAVAALVRSALEDTTGADGRKLPTVASVGLRARANQTVLALPYIRRDAEHLICEYLQARSPVLVIGPSMTGKTTMAAAVLEREFGSWRVAIPAKKTALADLDAKGILLHGRVIWLDDVDRLIGPEGITKAVLRRLIAADNIIVGTIRARAYDQFLPSDQLHPPEWDVLDCFKHVFLTGEMSSAEIQQIIKVVPDLELRQQIIETGIGEYAGAAGQIIESLKLGASGIQPVGYALVKAAADWRRCGMARPIPEGILKSLAAIRLNSRGQEKLADQQTYEGGLAWAMRDINRNVSLLQSAGAGFYNVYEYALDYLSGQDLPIPDATWDVVIGEAGIPELGTLGYLAAFRHDNIRAAVQAWRLVANSKYPDIAPRAAFGLGIVLRQHGDVAGAKEAFQKAIDSGDPDQTPLAALSLGRLLANQGDVIGARETFQKAIDSGHVEAAPLAAVSLGFLLQEQGDVAGAKEAFQKAIDSGDVDQAPLAAVSLGFLLQEQGDVAGAREIFQKAIDSGHVEAAPLAASAFGILLQQHIDATSAREALQKAIDSGDVDQAPLAAVSLGAMLEEQGDIAGARAALQKAIDSGHAGAAPYATFSLGAMLEEQGDIAGARAAFQKVLESGHANFAREAAIKLEALPKEH